MTRFLVGRDWLAVWILWSGWCAVTGWTLSLLHQFDWAGYLTATGFFFALLVLALRHLPAETTRGPVIFRLSTYKRWLPRGWVLLALLALTGGLLYHPDNYDFLSYRFPRLLSWWWAHHWFWIDTVHQRQNYSGVGMEWLMAPAFVLFRSDRLFFLLNFFPYLLIPGLLFGVLRRLGVNGRVAWTWMWVLPGGLCFILQAASMGNDTFAAVYFLAALFYALRARPGVPQALPLSLLSLALTTGAKATNLPLLLPWAVVLWWQREPALASLRWGWVLASLPVALLASFLPLGLANLHYTGAFSGDPKNAYRLQISNPVAGIAGNSLELVAANLSPPIWPNDPKLPGQKFLAAKLRTTGYPRFDFNSRALPLEENVGLGLGVTLFGIIAVISGVRHRSSAQPRGSFPALFSAASLLAVLAYLTKMGSEAAPRLFAIYYVALVLAAMLLLAPDGLVVRRATWQAAAAFALCVGLPGLIFNPSRPLLPEEWLASSLRAIHVSQSSVVRLEDNYRMRGRRRDWFAPLRDDLPAEEKVIGCLTGEDDPEVAPWLPFGSRGVIEVAPETELAPLGLRYVVVNADAVTEHFHLDLPALLKKWKLRVIAQEKVTFKSARHADSIYLLGPL